jgi:formylglycine-generating enzyme required for sulfatase activity
LEEEMKKILFTAIAITGILLFVGCPNDTIPTTYAVTVSPSGAETGESVSADASEAAEGATVTLTATLNSGRLVALSASGVTISPSTIGSDEGTATFTMPAAAVEVTATFSYDAGAAVLHTATSVDFNMHYVPSGGPFTMGEHVESTTQEVTLTKNFWMGETEVTQGLWEDVWGTTWPGDPGDVPISDYGLGATYPAYYVNWYDAAAFCNLLTLADSSIADSEQVYYSDTELNTAYTKANAANSDAVYADWSKKGFRLLTEAEWEYAARYIDGTSWNNGDHASGDTEYACYDPGSGTVSGSPLASDARISQYAWWNGNNSGGTGDSTYGTKEVGQKTANPLGLHDMSGNVFEWCYDWHEAYSGGSEADPTGPTSGSNRVMRGGFWDTLGSYLRCADRDNDSPSDRFYGYGFRLCRTAD